MLCGVLWGICSVVYMCGGWVGCVPSQRAAFDVNRLNAMAKVHCKTPAFRDAMFLRSSLNFSVSPCLLLEFHALAPLLSPQLN